MSEPTATNSEKSGQPGKPEKTPETAPAPERGAEDLQRACDELGRKLEEVLARQEKELTTWGIWAKVAVVLILGAYFTWLYGYIASFDARNAVLMSRGMMEERLPHVKNEVIVEMKKAAPKVVADWKEGAIRGLPAMRQRLQEELLAFTDEMCQRLEGDLNSLLSGMLRDARRELDTLDKGLSTREKLDIIVEHVRQAYREESRAAVDHLAGELGGDLHELNQKFKRLARGKDLTRKERIQRDLLAVWNKLVHLKSKELREALGDPLRQPLEAEDIVEGTAEAVQKLDQKLQESPGEVDRALQKLQDTPTSDQGSPEYEGP